MANEKKSEKSAKKVVKAPAKKSPKKVVKKPAKVAAKKAVKKVVKPKAPKEAVAPNPDAIKIDELKTLEVKTDSYQPEASVSGVAKNFVIRCPKCRWARLSSGVSSDIKDLHEVRPGCKTCGRWRRFQCVKCGVPCPMKRIKGNS
jgi:hypothetical protein